LTAAFGADPSAGNKKYIHGRQSAASFISVPLKDASCETSSMTLEIQRIRAVMVTIDCAARKVALPPRLAYNIVKSGFL
jgi:hypothetical protein